MRRTIITISAVLVVAAGSVATGWAVAPRHSAVASAVRTPAVQRTVHLVRSYPVGPSAAYSGDTGSIGLTTPLNFRLPASAEHYSATVTLSFQYRTTGRGHFYLAPTVKSGGKERDVIAPAQRNLGASGSTSTTMVLRAGLRSGVTYSLSVGANVNRTNPKPVSIATRRMVVEIEAWPGG